MIKASSLRDPILAALTSAVVARFQPVRIVLYGSRARGDYAIASDYDLMVELAQVEDFPKLRQEIREVVREHVEAFDITLRTPEIFQRRRDDPGTLDWAIAREGLVIYPPEADPLSIRQVHPARVRKRPDEPPPSLREWVRRAEVDILVVDRVVAAEPIPWSAICFHAQQAAEKYLKALLVLRHIHPPRTHNTSELLAAARRMAFALPGLDDACRELAAYAVEPRYPDDDFWVARPLPTEGEGRAAVEAMRTIVEAVKSYVS